MAQVKIMGADGDCEEFDVMYNVVLLGVVVVCEYIRTLKQLRRDLDAALSADKPRKRLLFSLRHNIKVCEDFLLSVQCAEYLLTDYARNGQLIGEYIVQNIDNISVPDFDDLITAGTDNIETTLINSIRGGNENDI